VFPGGDGGGVEVRGAGVSVAPAVGAGVPGEVPAPGDRVSGGAGDGGGAVFRGVVADVEPGVSVLQRGVSFAVLLVGGELQGRAVSDAVAVDDVVRPDVPFEAVH